MCGIVGYLGNKNAKDVLIDKLKMLEYRGYDSAGIATQNAHDFEILKSVGNISNLENLLASNTTYSQCGIAHTRWATHGQATIENAHPHSDSSQQWVSVHNGIIDNYKELQSKLQDVHFYSQTDSEIIPNLLNSLNLKTNILKVCQLTKLLKGSYALCLLCKNQPNTLFLAKKQSPLYLAKTINEIIVASDPMCFAGISEYYYTLEDYDCCQASLKEIVFYNDGQIIEKTPQKLCEFDLYVTKSHYRHFMHKEIMETPSALHNLTKVYADFFNNDTKLQKIFKKIKNIIIIGCGTAYHSGLIGEKYLQKYLKLPARTYIASEFLFEDCLLDSNTLCIAVSQSGETADTLNAVKLAKQKGAKCICLTNVAYSSLARICDIVLPICAGREIAVASTKAYVCQLAVFFLLARFIDEPKNIHTYLDQINKISQLISQQDNNLDELINLIKKSTKCMFLGKQLDYITAEEASLKLKEITYLNSIAYPSGELKHGCLALVENDTPVVVFATCKETLEKNLNSACEAQSRGAKIIFISQFESQNDFFVNIKLPDCVSDLMPLISIIPMQLLSYYVAVAKGYNPDQPRNLAKSVTVE